MSGPLYSDNVGVSNINVAEQILGASTSPTDPPAFPHDGLIGFAGQGSSAVSFPPNLSPFVIARCSHLVQSSTNNYQSDSTPWFTNVCAQNLVPACRFGLAYNTDGTGTQTLGAVDPAYADSLTTVPIEDQWIVSGDIVAGGKTISSRASIITDSGTSVVYGLVPPPPPSSHDETLTAV